MIKAFVLQQQKHSTTLAVRHHDYSPLIGPVPVAPLPAVLLTGRRYPPPHPPPVQTHPLHAIQTPIRLLELHSDCIQLLCPPVLALSYFFIFMSG